MSSAPAAIVKSPPARFSRWTSYRDAGASFVAVLACYLLYLAIWSLALLQHGLSPVFLAAMGLALLQVLWHYRMIRSRSRAGCFKAFRLNHWLGFTVFLGIALALARP